MHRRATVRVVAAFVGAIVASSASIAYAKHYGAWGPPQKVDEIAGNSSDVNTPFVDGCPIQSPDGLSLYMASNRPRFGGDTRTDLDIWVARREHKNGPWGAPENVGAPVNSTADDFCPTPVRGHGLFFASRRAIAGACGGSDIYFTHLHRKHRLHDPAAHLGCQADGGPNGAADEQGPSFVVLDGKTQLYFSSGPDIYVSEQLPDGSFGPAAPVAELNGPAGDFRPNLRKDGLEVVFDSNRADTRGGQDLYASTRAGVDEPWSVPINLGDVVNSDKNETRASFSDDAETLYFGRAPGPEGGTDIYVTTREKAKGRN